MGLGKIGSVQEVILSAGVCSIELTSQLLSVKTDEMGVWLGSVSCLVLSGGSSLAYLPIDASDAIQTRTLSIVSESGSLLLQVQLVLLLCSLNVRSIDVSLLFVGDWNLLRVHFCKTNNLLVLFIYIMIKA